jgi:hypothetical protein
MIKLFLVTWEVELGVPPVIMIFSTPPIPEEPIEFSMNVTPC